MRLRFDGQRLACCGTSVGELFTCNPKWHDSQPTMVPNPKPLAKNSAKSWGMTLPATPCWKLDKLAPEAKMPIANAALRLTMLK